MKMIIKTVLSIAALATFAGCSTDGIRFAGPGPSHADLDSFKNRVVSDAPQSTAKSVAKSVAKDMLAKQQSNHLIVIGEVGPYHPLDQGHLAKRYALYEKAAIKFHDRVNLAQTEYIKKTGGYASVIYFNIPTLAALSVFGEVPPEMAGRINYPSELRTMIFGSGGDLVAAETNGDGWFWIAKDLCSITQKNYSECTKQYAKGRFESISGMELGTDLKPKSNGVRIDPVSFKKVQ